MKVFYPITLDVKKTNVQKIIRANQGEGADRELCFTLVSGTEKLNLTAENTVSIIGKKPDGTVFDNACTIKNGKVYYYLTTQNLAVVGDVDCQLSIISDGLTYSAKFVIDVEEAIVPDETIESANEFSQLVELIQTAGYGKVFTGTTAPGTDPDNYTNVKEDDIYLNIGSNSVEVYHADSVSTTVTWTKKYEVYTKSKIDTELANYYTKSQMDTALDLKADKSTTYTKTETNALVEPKLNVYIGDDDPLNGITVSSDYTGIKVGDIYLWEVSESVYKVCVVHAVLTIAETTRFYCNTLANIGEIPLIVADTTPPERASEYSYKHPKNGTTWFNNTTGKYYVKTGESGAMPETTFTWDEVVTLTQFTTALNLKADKSTTYTKTQIDTDRPKIYTAKSLDIEKGVEAKDYTSSTPACDDFTNVKAGDIVKDETSSTLNGVYVVTDLWEESSKTYFKCTKVRRNVYFEEEYESGGVTYTSPPSYPSSFYEKIEPGALWIEDSGNPGTYKVYVNNGISDSNNMYIWFEAVSSSRLSNYATKYYVDTGLAAKQDTLTAGTNITIDANNVISATGGSGGSYSAGNGIDITNNAISSKIDTNSFLDFDSNGKIILQLSSLATDSTFRQALARGDYQYALATLSGVTTALSSKQDTIDSSHKLSADLINTSGTLNQFLPSGASNGNFLSYGTTPQWVTLNADLVDDTNTTNKFTNATEKQTWNAKEDKTTISTDTTSTTVSLTLADNHEYRYTQELTSLTLTMPSGDFIASVVFASGSTPTSMTYDSSIKWSGDDITNGQFVPSADKDYDIMMYYNGLNVNGIVRGV